MPVKSGGWQGNNRAGSNYASCDTAARCYNAGIGLENDILGRCVVDRDRTEATGRICPWCESTNVRFVQRGYAGLTDEVDQFLVCEGCNRTTYEIVSKTVREMRLGRYKPGDIYPDRVHKTRYTISRVLRVGQNEFLIYLKPLADQAAVLR
jgi:hypothetical protein